MRLLTVTHYFDSHRGGVELVAGRLNREFAKKGVDVCWLASGASPPPAGEPRAEHRPVPMWNIAERRLGVPFPLPGLSALAQIADTVRGCDAVLLHDSLYLGNVAAFIAARLHRKPVLIIQHIGAVPYRNPLLRGVMALANRLVARPLLAHAEQVCFISEITARYFDGVRYRRKPALVFNGVDIECFKPVDAAARNAAREAYCWSAAQPVALFVGRFVEKKGLLYLEAAARARPDILWIFAGWGPIDPRAWRLPNVQVFEGVNHLALARLYQAADALVLPSIGEGFPLVIQEALASGLPVICGAETASADSGAAAWLTGLDLDGARPESVADQIGEAVDRLMHTPRDRSDRARFAHDRYSWSIAAARHLQLIRSLLPGATP